MGADFLSFFLSGPSVRACGPPELSDPLGKIELEIETIRLLPRRGEVTRPMCTAAEPTAPSSTGQALTGGQSPRQAAPGNGDAGAGTM